MRHLMEPDPDTGMPSLRLVLWVAAVILCFVILAVTR